MPAHPPEFRRGTFDSPGVAHRHEDRCPSGDSNRQVRALANNVCEEVRKAGGRVFSTEGEQTGEWVLVDLGAVIVHVMQPAIRQYYNLEEIWGTPQVPKARKTAVRKTSAGKAASRAAK